MEGVRKTILEMMGEALREMAVLVVVLAPLDRWVEHRPYTPTDSWETFGISGILFVFGVILERRRKI
jgi:hypothetical protein